MPGILRLAPGIHPAHTGIQVPDPPPVREVEQPARERFDVLQLEGFGDTLWRDGQDLGRGIREAGRDLVDGSGCEDDFLGGSE